MIWCRDYNGILDHGSKMMQDSKKVQIQLKLEANLGGDEGSGPDLSCGTFEGDIDANLEGVGPGDIYLLGNLQGTRVDNKIGISNGEVPGITLGVAGRRKLWDDRVSGSVLSGGSCEGTRYGKLEHGSKELQDSSI